MKSQNPGFRDQNPQGGWMDDAEKERQEKIAVDGVLGGRGI